ncbi:hypothetical protein PHMEG_00037881, partial [Phytophthora megakarya]
GYWRQQDPDLWFKPTNQEVTPEIQRPSKIAEYRQSTTMELLQGESRGYWKHHSPGKWFRQAKITGKIHNEKAILLLDTGAEVSIVDTAFASKVGCYIDSSQIQDCVILGMDFMVSAGIRLDLAHGSISLSDEVRIQLSGRRQLYSDKAKIVNVGQYLRIQAGESVELPLRLRSSIHDKLWVTRRDQWVPTISTLEATTDTRSEEMEVENPLMLTVERPEYETSRAILQRPKVTLIQRRKVEASRDQDIPDCPPSDEPPPDKSPSDKLPSEMRPWDLASVASEESDLSSIADEGSISHAATVKEAPEDHD